MHYSTALPAPSYSLGSTNQLIDLENCRLLHKAISLAKSWICYSSSLKQEQVFMNFDLIHLFKRAVFSCKQVADGVDEEFIILPNGQVAAQQKPKPPVRRPSPVRRTRSLSPKKSSGLLGKLCSRFRSPSNRQRRAESHISQAAAIAAYKDAYGTSCTRP